MQPVYRTLLLAVACQLLLRYRVQAEVVSAVLLPHGHVMLTPDAYNGQSSAGLETAKQLYATAVPVRELLQQTRPELIILITPHGQTVGHNITLYQQKHAAGAVKAADAEYFSTINIDTRTTGALYNHLLSHQQAVSILQPLASPDTTATSSVDLDWGEVIPWHILGNPSELPAVIISLPGPKGSQTDRVPELLTLGQLLGSFLSQPGSPRTLVAISADLAHTHSLEGPYGTSPAAALYDAAVREWAATGAAQQLLETAAGYADEAKTCGFMGSVLLQGILTAAVPGNQGVDSSSASNSRSWQSHVLAYGHPTYFGMMVATWTPTTQQQQQGAQSKHIVHTSSKQKDIQKVLHASFEASPAEQEHFDSDVRSEAASNDDNVSDRTVDGGEISTDDSSYAYELEDVDQLKAIRREAKAGWRTRSKHDILNERSGTCVI